MENYNAYCSSSYHNHSNNNTLEVSLADTDFQKIKPTYGMMKLIFEFPPQSFKDEQIKQEVKAIMAGVLQEQLLLKTS